MFLNFEYYIQQHRAIQQHFVLFHRPIQLHWDEWFITANRFFRDQCCSQKAIQFVEIWKTILTEFLTTAANISCR